MSDAREFHGFAFPDGRSTLDHPAKRKLLERLCPASTRWRARALGRGVRLAQRAAAWAFSGRHAN